MKKPVLEVIRFDEADIITASGLGMGFTADNFGDDTQGNGTFSFFGGSSGVERHGAHETNIVSAFKSYFGWSRWSSTDDILVNGSTWGAPLEEMITRDQETDEDDNLKYNGTYYYRNGIFDWRSH